MIIKIQKNQYFSSFEGDFKVSKNIEMNYFNGNEYEVLYPTVSLTNTVNSLSATNVSYSNSSTSSIITSNQVQGAIDDLFTSVSNGKNLIASAITDKGVSTSGSSSWDVMAENIRNISTGYQVKIPSFQISDNYGAGRTQSLSANFYGITNVRGYMFMRNAENLPLTSRNTYPFLMINGISSSLTSPVVTYASHTDYSSTKNFSGSSYQRTYRVTISSNYILLQIIYDNDYSSSSQKADIFDNGWTGVVWGN